MFQLIEPSSFARYDHLIGGFCSGIASTAVCHPLDLLKTRFSANEGNNPLRPKYTGYFDAAKQIVKSGGFRGLYKGFIPNVTGNALAWGLFFPIYNEAKHAIPAADGWETPSMFLSGILAGTCVMTVTNPIWVAKVRLMLQYENGEKKYSGMFDCFRKIYAEEGISGWYRTNFETIYCSAISKVVATTAIFPYQVLRTRLQDHHVRNRGIFSTTQRVVRHEGISGLYKGCMMANIRLLPAALVTFVTYENVRHYIRSLGDT